MPVKRIIELVLFWVAQQHHETRRNKSPDGVLACFKRIDRRYYEFSGKEIQVELNERHLRTKLYGCHQQDLRVEPRDVRLEMLIKAGVDIGLYDKEFSERLSKLNDLRNGIHLRKQTLLKKKFAEDDPFKHVYTQAALENCKNCVEELRQRLIGYRQQERLLGAK